MQLYSTNLQAPDVDFETALFTGIAPDKGLYMPREIPLLDQEVLDRIREEKLSFAETAFYVLRAFLKDEIDDKEMRKITKSVFDFQVPLEMLEEKKYILQLDHGPTANYYDFSARLMVAFLKFFLKKEKRKVTIFMATKGETGAAMAHAVYGLDNLRLVLLFPEKEIGVIQKSQLAMKGDNITALAVQGTLQDCEDLEKQAIADPDFQRMNFVPGDSRNFSCLLAQVIFFIYSYLHVTHHVGEKGIFSIPSGNMGNLVAGILAKRMGIPVQCFIAAFNDNAPFVHYLETGKYEPMHEIHSCLSRELNVLHPWNLTRLLALYGGVMDTKANIGKGIDVAEMQKEIFAVSVSDVSTIAAMKDVYSRYEKISEPHLAVGYAGFNDYVITAKNVKDKVLVYFETVHPAKYGKIIKDILDITPQLPKSLEDISLKEERYLVIGNEYEELRKLFI